MKIEKFISGKYMNQNGYKTFLPSEINGKWEWEDSKINMLLEQASAELGG